MFASAITASVVAALGGTLLFLATSVTPADDPRPAAEGLSEAQALDDRMLEALNETDGYRANDLVAELFTEDATFTRLWGPGEVDVDPDRLHIAAQFLDPMTAARVEPLVELPPPADGDTRYVGIYDFTYGSGPLWPGTVCETWAREQQIYRFDCIFPKQVSIAMSD